MSSEWCGTVIRYAADIPPCVIQPVRVLSYVFVSSLPPLPPPCAAPKHFRALQMFAGLESCCYEGEFGGGDEIYYASRQKFVTQIFLFPSNHCT